MMRLIALFLALLALAGIRTPDARAVPISAAQASAVVQAAAFTGEMILHAQLFGDDPGNALTYTTTTYDSDGWTANATGALLGSAVSVTHAGSTAGFPGGPVTWTSSGSYGASAWNGSGSAQFADSGGGDFTIAMVIGLTVGAQNKALDFTMTGTELATGHYEIGGIATGSIIDWFVDLLFGPEPASGTGPGSSGPLKESLVLQTMIEIEGGPTVTSVLNFQCTPTTGFQSCGGGGGGGYYDAPEPSTLTLLMLPLALGLFRAGWRRNRSRL